MQLALFPKLKSRPINYSIWANCPLCGQAGSVKGALQRTHYRFGRSIIPLPSEGIALLECQSCTLLYKGAVPRPDSLAHILSEEAVNEWRSKSGDHPSIAQLIPFTSRETTALLDIGASNGDLLRGMAPYCKRLSAFDAVPYPACKDVVNDEYIIGSFEEAAAWSGNPYDVVTAFDVFEHFLDPTAAIKNILNFVRPGGKLIIETGNWRAAQNNLTDWYYCNLVEHQIFWSKESFEYLCGMFNLELSAYDRVNHKYRRVMSKTKKLAISTYRQFGRSGWSRKTITSLLGVDPALLSPPDYVDHLFVVLTRK